MQDDCAGARARAGDESFFADCFAHNGADKSISVAAAVAKREDSAGGGGRQKMGGLRGVIGGGRQSIAVSSYSRPDREIAVCLCPSVRVRPSSSGRNILSLFSHKKHEAFAIHACLNERVVAMDRDRDWLGGLPARCRCPNGRTNEWENEWPAA